MGWSQISAASPKTKPVQAFPNQVDGHSADHAQGRIWNQAMGAAARLHPNNPEAWTFHGMQFRRLQLQECQTHRQRRCLGRTIDPKYIPSKEFIVTSVAVVGAGALGAAMATRLAEGGFDVCLWNRTAARAEKVAADSGRVVAARTVAVAVAEADVVLTVLRDGPAVAAVAEQMLPAMRSDAVWVQVSTVGPVDAHKLRDTAANHGINFLDAPVSGSTPQAKQGALLWLVSGQDAAVNIARPVLERLGKEVSVVGAGLEASALKLAINTWLAASTVAIADVLKVCDALEVPHETLARTLQATPLAMPFAFAKIDLMEKRQYPAGFAVDLALKDIELTVQNARLRLPFLEAVRERLMSTVGAGHGREDVAAVYEADQ
jgi:3-hydroxyisobutyrate dehydrogenase